MKLSESLGAEYSSACHGMATEQSGCCMRRVGFRVVVTCQAFIETERAYDGSIGKRGGVCSFLFVWAFDPTSCG